MIKKIIKFILIVVWMGIIFIFSSDNGEASTKKSDGVIIKTVEFFYGRELTTMEKEKWTTYLVVPVRKGAHFSVYFVLGILILSFILEFMSLNKLAIKLAAILSILYACSDEVHQLFVPGRSGQALDIFIDACGAALGIIIYSLIWRLRHE